ncbi:alcohol dehydrogenase [Caldalkalibacillus uzonensis]|uniref:Alcohol dehydrogenase n=1 Tax=Caldalkalibacillus uzonensis TaxID=353224 RepID=A0ABU0CYE5_9BACI|nr:iron-containing alcohol dehydrogenase [Caldalkalibacillus uzonensis]MDQ0341176.1 alcohol dehydrogenase [Caldalkalibacillus uzonensis]
MTESFQYHLPTKIYFGYGKTNELENLQLPMRNVFIVTDKAILNAGLVEYVLKILKQKDVRYHVYDQVEPDPSVETVDKAAKAFKEAECDMIIAIGGGSPIDTAKGIRVVASNGGSIRDYAGVDLVKAPPKVPLVVLPTTSGTGSEVTIFAVFSDWIEKRKVTVTSSYLAPDVAIVDPKLTMTVPPFVTAATGIDAFAHGVETFVSRIAQPVSDALALSAMKTVYTYLRRAVYNGKDKTARIKMAEASLLAGMAFNQSFLGLTHAIGSAVSGHVHVSHGVTIGLLLPSVMKYNMAARPDKYAQIARVFHQNTGHLSERKLAERVVEDITELRNDIGLPQKLREVGVKEEQLEPIAEDSLKSGMWQFNPIQAPKEDIYKLLKEIF